MGLFLQPRSPHELGMAPSSAANALMAGSQIVVYCTETKRRTKLDSLRSFPNVAAAGRCYADAASDAMFRPFCVVRRDSSKRHILGVAHSSGGCDPQIRTQPRSLCNSSTPKFHHPMFTRSKVIVLIHTQTHKQADSGENIQRSSLRYDVGY